MDNRYAIKKNQMGKRRLSTELENINSRLEDSLCLIEHDVNEIKRDQEQQSETEPEIDLLYLKKKSDLNDMLESRRRASSFGTVESPKKPNLHKVNKFKSKIAESAGQIQPRNRRMSLPANLLHSHDPFPSLKSNSSRSSLNKGSDSSLKGSRGDLRRSHGSITRIPSDSSPEMEKYESQLRRLKYQLHLRRPKSIKQLERIPLTSTEERHIRKYLQEEEYREQKAKRNAEILESIQNCNYIRKQHDQELTVDEMLDQTPD